jgi:hypothetical protein
MHSRYYQLVTDVQYTSPELQKRGLLMVCQQLEKQVVT